jgi:hypothetical protein
LESPEQSIINDVNQGHYGDGFTASIGQPEQAHPDNRQQMQDLSKSVEGIGEGVAAFPEAKNNADRRNDEESAATANKNVAAGTGPEPPPGEDNGNDYYNGYSM